jgi:hypothetical protein
MLVGFFLFYSCSYHAPFKRVLRRQSVQNFINIRENVDDFARDILCQKLRTTPFLSDRGFVQNKVKYKTGIPLRR